jgi:hypothetical protein
MQEFDLDIETEDLEKIKNEIKGNEVKIPVGPNIGTVAITQEQLESIKKDLEEKQNGWMKDPYFRRWLPKWVSNCMENYSQIKKDFSKESLCLSTQPKANRPAIIIGGGPSLDENIKYLKDWKHPILVPSSMAFNTVYEIERDPDFISAFDSLDKTAEHIGNYKWKNSTLLAHPTTEPKTLTKWKWRKLYYRRFYKNISFYEYVLPMMYPMIKIGIVFTGNVINNGINVLEILGYNPIFLVGADLGWWNHNKPRASVFEQTKNGNIEYKQHQSTKNRQDILELKNGLKIDHSMISFKNDLLRVIMSNKERRVYDCSNGFIKEIPKLDIKEVIKTNGTADYGYDFDEMNKNVKNYFENELKDLTSEFEEKFKKIKEEQENAG